MLAVTIFAVTLILVITQPRGLGIGWSALGGAAVALLTGVIHWTDIPRVWHIVWDATFTFVALIIISLVLDEAGFFQWAALHIARWGRGRGTLLFALILVLGTLIAAVFANDGAALLLTPIMLAILIRLRLSPSAVLAFVIATGFIADTTSLPLMISNLVNIVSANYFNIPFNRYAAVMIPIDLVAFGATFLVLWAYFRREIPRSYALDGLEQPSAAVRDPLVFQASFPLLTLLLAAYFVTAPYHIPVSAVTGAAAIILLGLAGRWHTGGRGQRIALGKVLREAPWQIVLFSVGMYLVVYGLQRAGLTAWLSALLSWLAAQGPATATIGTGFLAAALSSVMNNLPAVLIGALAIHHAPGIPPLVRESMIYANVIGCDLGPKFTPIGSLATLLWLHVLERKGQTITAARYMKVGVVITPPVLLATLGALVWWLPRLGGS